jgi:hypothetical protein
VRDRHYGAAGHPPIAADYYLVDSVPKRFFDQEAVERLFARGWRCLLREERVIDRYERPKVAWEVALERRPAEDETHWPDADEQGASRRLS